MNSNQANLFFERELLRVSSWLKGKVGGGCGYSAAMLHDRLMQRLVEVSLQPYTKFAAGLSSSDSDSVHQAESTIDCGCAHLKLGSGHISITLFRWLRNQFDFFLHWSYCLVAIIGISFRRKTDFPAVLVFGVGEESLFQGGSDSRFVKFCHAGPVIPLREGKRFLVQSTTKGACSSDKDFSYCRFPLIELLRATNLGIVPRIVMTIKHFALLFNYSFCSFGFPLLSLIAKDFPYAGVSRELDKRGFIDSVVMTGSNYTSQPLWTRVLSHPKVHMVWYSQSAQPIIYRDDGIESDTPNLRWIRIDTLWLWTHSLAEYARRLIPKAKIEVVGPILWYLPESLTPPAGKINIQIFDVPALTDELALLAGLFPNYMCGVNLSAFVDHILELKTALEENYNLPVSVSLKTKRQYHQGNDRGYFDYLERLSLTGKISLEHYEKNMYSLITKSHLVIVYPFSSPAYVADSVGVPSIYYDPTASIVRRDYSDHPTLIQFANTRKELYESSVKALGLVF